MARTRRLIAGGKIFFVTTNLRRAVSPFTPQERDLLCDCLVRIRSHCRFQLLGFVVMPDHLHLLVHPADEDTLSALVQELKYVTGRKINASRGTRGALWQKGFFDRFMRTPKEVSETLDYMHLNPVRKGLVRTADEWRWTSARNYAGMQGAVEIEFISLPAQSERRLG